MLRILLIFLRRSDVHFRHAPLNQHQQAPNGHARLALSEPEGVLVSPAALSPKESKLKAPGLTDWIRTHGPAGKRICQPDFLLKQTWPWHSLWRAVSAGDLTAPPRSPPPFTLTKQSTAAPALGTKLHGCSAQCSFPLFSGLPRRRAAEIAWPECDLPTSAPIPTPPHPPACT